MKYLVLLLLLTSCTENSTIKVPTSIPDGLSLACVEVGASLLRCENKEAICYVSQYTSHPVTPSCTLKSQ